MVCELDGPTPILKRSKTLVTKQDSPDAGADGLPKGVWQASRRLGERPFVLLDDARAGGTARLFTDPIEIIETREPEEARLRLDRLRGAGRHAAGFISYEAGHMLERRLEPLCRRPAEEDPPLLWFGVFESFEEVDTAGRLPDAQGSWAGRPRPLVELPDHEAAIARALNHILAG